MKKNKSKLIKYLANEFNNEFIQIPVTVLPNDDIIYNHYLIKKEGFNWCLYNLNNKDLMAQFFLKSCALVAAKYHDTLQLNKYFEINQLDKAYWRTYSNSMIYKHNIKNTKDDDKKMMLLNRLECSEIEVTRFKNQISRLFRCSFV
jgi:hypothetical protein